MFYTGKRLERVREHLLSALHAKKLMKLLFFFLQSWVFIKVIKNIAVEHL